MKKRSYLLIFMGLLSLGTLPCHLASCGASSPSISPTPTPNATEQMATITAFAKATADPMLNLIGSYTGTYKWQGKTSSLPMHLEITQQKGIRLTGKCLLDQQSFALLHAVTSPAFGGREGVITFTLDIPASRGQQANSLNFSGGVTKEGVMTGEVSASDEKQGTWSVQKTKGDKRPNEPGTSRHIMVLVPAVTGITANHVVDASVYS